MAVLFGYAFVRTTDGLHVYLMKKRYVIRLTACRDVGDSGVLQERQYGAEVYVCDAGGGWSMRVLTIEIND